MIIFISCWLTSSGFHCMCVVLRAVCHLTLLDKLFCICVKCGGGWLVFVWTYKITLTSHKAHPLPSGECYCSFLVSTFLNKFISQLSSTGFRGGLDLNGLRPAFQHTFLFHRKAHLITFLTEAHSDTSVRLRQGTTQCFVWGGYWKDVSCMPFYYKFTWKGNV